MRLIDAEALETKIKKIKAEALKHGFAPEYVAVDILLNFLNGAPTIEAYTGAEYMHLLKLAKKMHTWIFLHTFNEDETYKELGLTDEDNALLGSFGKFYYSCNPNSKPFSQAHENGGCCKNCTDHIAEGGKKEAME